MAGVIETAAERGILAFGNIIHPQDLYPKTVVASALWHMEPTIDAALKAVKAGQWKAEDYGRFSLMKAGGGSLAPLGSFDDKLPAELKKRVAVITAKLPSQERPKETHVLHEEFTMENGLLTPTLKVRRREVEKRFKEIVDEMYARLDKLRHER